MFPRTGSKLTLLWSAAAHQQRPRPAHPGGSRLELPLPGLQDPASQCEVPSGPGTGAGPCMTGAKTPVRPLSRSEPRLHGSRALA
ncbi:MAG: hypothetical protein OXC62_08165 [Aestuariivita sp.]|nr:hypothetical protein [Aestuariivita sp.]